MEEIYLGLTLCVFHNVVHTCVVDRGYLHKYVRGSIVRKFKEKWRKNGFVGCCSSTKSFYEIHISFFGENLTGYDLSC